MHGLTRLTASAAVLLVAAFAHADEQDLTGKIGVELNAAQTAQGKCTLSFLVTNGTKSDIEKLVYETVLFTKAGQVDRLTLFDFGQLPVGRPRVRQFVVPATACEGLGRILFNGASTCTGDGLASDACEKGLVLTTRTEIEALG